MQREKGREEKKKSDRKKKHLLGIGPMPGQYKRGKKGGGKKQKTNKKTLHRIEPGSH